MPALAGHSFIQLVNAYFFMKELIGLNAMIPTFKFFVKFWEGITMEAQAYRSAMTHHFASPCAMLAASSDANDCQV